MNVISDPLIRSSRPDRLHYATGELLGADDFVAEQTYHRRQLARALQYLYGSGTIAGLRVVANHKPGSSAELDEVELLVEPGLALDRAGRLIEVPREACLRLRRWYEHVARTTAADGGLAADDLRGSWRPDSIPAGGAVVADIFLTFHACDRGYTPAFASGPFDALDASQPSRVRDAYELSLVPRPEADADLPTAFDLFAKVAGMQGVSNKTGVDRLQAASLGVWKLLEEEGRGGDIPAGVDPTSVLIARLRIPAAEAGPDAAPAPDWRKDVWPAPATWESDGWPDGGSNVDNTVRNFIVPSALQHAAGS